MDFQASLEQMWRRKTREIIDAAKAEILAALPVFRGGKMSTGALPPHSHDYDPTGTAAAAVAAHEGAADPHTQYQRESEKGSANGYASLGADTKVPTAELGGAGADSTKFLRGDQSWQAPPGASLTVKEEDGAPSVAGVTEIKVTNGTVTDNGGGSVSLDFGSAATDGAAIHDNVASEIHAVTEKVGPVDDDEVLVEDSADGYAKKRVKVGNLPGGGGTTMSNAQVRVVLYDSGSLAQDTASIDVQSLAQTYDDLEMVIESRSTRSAAEDQILVAFNADTTAANYRIEVHWAGGAGHGNPSSDAREIGQAPGATAPANFGVIRSFLAGYAKTDRHKQYMSLLAQRLSDTDQRVHVVSGIWENNAAITRVTLAPSAGSFLAGSRIRIIGIKTADILVP
jgi:hypothetical protein